MLPNVQLIHSILSRACAQPSKTHITAALISCTFRLFYSFFHEKQSCFSRGYKSPVTKQTSVSICSYHYH